MEKSNMKTAKEFLIFNTGISSNDVEYQMIAFAKMHVEAALKEASQKLRQASGTFNSDYSDQKISILMSYPLTNIT